MFREVSAMAPAWLHILVLISSFPAASAIMDMRHFASDDPPRLPDFVNPGVPPPSFIYALDQNQPPYDISVDTLEPFPGCDAYHGAVCAVQHSIRLVTRARQELCPLIEAGGASKLDALASVNNSTISAAGTRGFGVFLLETDGTIAADELFPYFIGQRIDGFMVSGQVVQNGFLSRIAWVVDSGGGFVPHYSWRVSEHGSTKPLPTLTYFEKCSTGERLGVSFGREPLPLVLPCTAETNNFCVTQNIRRVLGQVAVDFLSVHDDESMTQHFYNVDYDDAYLLDGTYVVLEAVLAQRTYPGTGDAPFWPAYSTFVAMGGPMGAVGVGHNYTTMNPDLAAYGYPEMDPYMGDPMEKAAYTGGAWQDTTAWDEWRQIWMTWVTFSIGFAFNSTGYVSSLGLAHRPRPAPEGPQGQTCSAAFAWPCAIVTAWRLAAHAYMEYLTPLGNWSRISSDPWFGSAWVAALQQIEAGAPRTWPAGFHILAAHYNGTIVADGAVEANVGRDANQVFGDDATHDMFIQAADNGGSWVERTDLDGKDHLVLVKKTAKQGQFYYMTVSLGKAWAPWSAEASSSFGTPSSERDAQALVGMALFELLGATDSAHLTERMVGISNRTGMFSPDVVGDFVAHVLAGDLTCIDGVPCERAAWPAYWMTVLAAAAVGEESRWVELPAVGSYKDSMALVMKSKWEESYGLAEFEFVLVTMVLQAHAAPPCTTQSDCPENAMCTETGCKCRGGFLSNITEVVDDASAIFHNVTLECRDVAGLACDGDVCTTCPAGYFCYQGSAAPCSPGYVCPAGISVVQLCPAGTKGVDAMATNFSSCQLCEPGSHSHVAGMTTCDPCAVGSQADREGAEECDRCDIGRYQDSTGASTCTLCDAGFTTEYRGAIDASECVCPSGTYLPKGGTSCLPCPAGMECLSANSTEVAIVSNLEISETAWPAPTAMKGFMSLTSNGLQVYRCKETNWCPGGLPGTCMENRDPSTVGCARCLDDHYTTTEGSCSRCVEGLAPLMLGGALILLLLVLTLAARVVNRNQISEPNSITTAIITLGLTVSAIQSLGIFITLTVEWMEPFRSMAEVLLLFSFDLQVLGVECVVGSQSVVSAILRQCLAPCIAIYIAVVVLLKKWLFDRSVELDIQITNAVGAIFQLFFVSIFVSVLTPFVCYKHPENLGYSMLDDPAVLCFQTGEHAELVMVSLCAFAVVILPFLALITWATVRYRAAMSSSLYSYRHLRRFRFLFFRYRPQCFWYGLVTLSRGVLVCLVPVVLRDTPSLQIMVLCIILLAICGLQMKTDPWRSNLANLVDSAVTMILVLLLVSVAMSTDFPDSASTLGILAASLFVLIFTLALGVGFYAIYRRVVPSPYYARFICHHKADAAAQARFLQQLFHRRTKQLCFIDSDHLTNLEELFDIVRCRCGDLTVYLTADTLKRPWCAGEVTMAWRVHKHVTVIHHPSFVDLSEDQFEVLESYMAPADFSLAEYGMTTDLIAEAFRWLLNDLEKQFHMSKDQAGRSRFEVVVDQILRSGQSRSEVNAVQNSVSSRASTKPGCVVVSSAPSDDEATAAIGIILGRVQASILEIVPRGLIVVADLLAAGQEEVSRSINGAHTVLAILSGETLGCEHQLRLLTDATAASVSCIPISLPAFRFPSKRFFRRLPEWFGEEASAVMETHLSLFFKVISVSIATFASQEVLNVQSDSILARFQKRPSLMRGKTSEFGDPASSFDTKSSARRSIRRPSLTSSVDSEDTFGALKSLDILSFDGQLQRSSC